MHITWPGGWLVGWYLLRHHGLRNGSLDRYHHHRLLACYGFRIVDVYFSVPSSIYGFISRVAQTNGTNLLHGTFFSENPLASSSSSSSLLVVVPGFVVKQLKDFETREGNQQRKRCRYSFSSIDTPSNTRKIPFRKKGLILPPLELPSSTTKTNNNGKKCNCGKKKTFMVSL